MKDIGAEDGLQRVAILGQDPPHSLPAPLRQEECDEVELPLLEDPQVRGAGLSVAPPPAQVSGGLGGAEAVEFLLVLRLKLLHYHEGR